MEASLAFYREIVGLPLDRQFAAPDGSAYAFLGEGETKLELIAHPAEQTPVFGGEVSIGFSVDSLEEKLRFVKEKGLSVEGPFAPGPMVRFFFVRDPNGLRVQFVQTK